MKQAQHHSIRKHKWCCLTKELDKQIEVFKKQLIEIKINNGERQGEKKAPRGMNRVNILFKHYNTRMTLSTTKELGYKATYILIGLGKLPFDIFT